MNTWVELVRDFQRTYGLYSNDTPVSAEDVPSREVYLRQLLMEEELNELEFEMQADNILGIAHELADLLYVVIGTGLAYGLPMDALIREVHRSNMTKDGQLSDTGKLTKGACYRPPDVLGVLMEHGYVLADS